MTALLAVAILVLAATFASGCATRSCTVEAHRVDDPTAVSEARPLNETQVRAAAAFDALLKDAITDGLAATDLKPIRDAYDEAGGPGLVAYQGRAIRLTTQCA